jgi:hypothetical protein
VLFVNSMVALLADAVKLGVRTVARTGREYYWEWAKRSMSGHYPILRGTVFFGGLIGACLAWNYPSVAAFMPLLGWLIPFAVFGATFAVAFMRAPYVMHLERELAIANAPPAGTIRVAELEKSLRQAEESRVILLAEKTKLELAADGISETAKASKVAAMQQLLLAHAAQADQPYTFAAARAWFSETHSIFEVAGLWRQQEFLRGFAAGNAESVNVEAWRKAAGAVKGIACTLEYNDIK